ncbi:MAG: ABC transporter permease subunit [Pseudonocardiaceae bacterium]|nr:ABC transporter permease subunit [Pseudonocardiaceae bacterium]
MLAYAGRRVLYLVPTWLGLSLLAFVIGDLAPGDPVRAYFQRTQGRPPTEAELAQTRVEFGVDGSLPERYLDWVGGAVQGDLGKSFSTGRPVLDELLSRLPATLELAGAAMLVALAIAVPVGTVAALYRNRLADQVLRIASLLGASLPGFFLAYLLIMLFSLQLGLLPALGYGDLRHLIMPALALGLAESAVLARLMRSSLLEVLGENYVRTARAKGLPEWQVVGRHGVGNSLNAVMTEAALAFATLLALSAIIEQIFVWPGIGRLVLEAISQRDYSVIQGFVLFAGTVFVLINLAVDLAYRWLDPRVTLQSERARTAVGMP